jgi:hypothetical protein
MPICANPEYRRLRIPVAGGAVILILREYTDKEFSKHCRDISPDIMRRKKSNKQFAARIDFINTLLHDIEAEGPEGEPDHVEYRDPQTGDLNKLDRNVEGWKDYVNPQWKIMAAVELEGQSAEEEQSVVKN